jgi:hypothetical protein
LLIKQTNKNVVVFVVVAAEFVVTVAVELAVFAFVTVVAREMRST